MPFMSIQIIGAYGHRLDWLNSILGLRRSSQLFVDYWTKGHSWISFLVNPEVIPGRMTLLVTIFLVLINIFNTIQTNSPKAEGLTGMFTIFFNL